VSVVQVAAKLGYTDVVRLLAHRGARCDKDCLERHPVALAANNGHIDTVKLLLELGYYEPRYVISICDLVL
jgi:ankyrin repeat protein